MMGRETHRRSGWKNERESQRDTYTLRRREREDHLIHQYTIWLLCCLHDIQRLGAKRILAFRSIRMTTMATSCWVALFSSYGWYDFSSTLILNYPYALFPFCQHINHNSCRFFFSFSQCHMCMYKCIYVHTYMCVCVCVCASPETVKMCHASLQ